MFQGSPDCNTRRECNGEEAYTTTAPLDRYEFLDSKFKMQKTRWPAFLVICPVRASSGTRNGKR